jgi:hypothetical protein
MQINRGFLLDDQFCMIVSGSKLINYVYIASLFFAKTKVSDR